MPATRTYPDKPEPEEIETFDGITMVSGTHLILSCTGTIRGTSCAIGIYSGPRPVSGALKTHNKCQILPPNYPQLLQVAELHAATMALDIAEEIIATGEIVDVVVLKVTSAAVHDGMVAWIDTWVPDGAGGYKTAAGGTVANGVHFARLDERIREFELKTQALVQFWLVKKGQNLEAEALATRAYIVD